MPSPNAEKLKQCFESVFPSLAPGDIESASHENLAAWDSVAQVTLLTLIGELFDFDIDYEEFESAASFSLLLETIDWKLAGEN